VSSNQMEFDFMEEIRIVDIPNKVIKVLKKEYNRLEAYKIKTKQPFLKSVCQHRQDLIKEFFCGKQRS